MYFLERPSGPPIWTPVLRLGNDTVWVLRANYHYGLKLSGGSGNEEILLADPVSEANDGG